MKKNKLVLIICLIIFSSCQKKNKVNISARKVQKSHFGLTLSSNKSEAKVGDTLKINYFIKKPIKKESSSYIVFKTNKKATLLNNQIKLLAGEFYKPHSLNDYFSIIPKEKGLLKINFSLIVTNKKSNKEVHYYDINIKVN